MFTLMEKLPMPRTPEVCSHVFTPLSQFSNGCCNHLTVLPLRRLIAAFSRRIFFRHTQYRLLWPSLIASCFLPSFRAACLLILLVTYHASLVPTYGQSASATLTGTVIDQNDAMVPDVKIAVINIAQGFERSATTKNDGTFVIPLLPPGNYIVKAEREGFSPAEVRDVVLNVNDQRHLKIPLKVGGVDQTVQIVDTSPLINESPAEGTVVDRQFVENLPLNGRSFQSLITLSPGVVLTKATGTNQGQFSVNGQRSSANYFSIDGVSANFSAPAASGGSLGLTFSGSVPGFTSFGGTNNLVSVDALQEFNILTSTYAPEFGRTPGAQVSIITRSGTKEFHGSVFNYFRNDALDANDWFANAARLRKPALRQNDFGGVVGGPVVLPRFGEGGPSFYKSNNTFFFFSYEGLRLRQPQVAFNIEVPSISLRQGAAAAIRPFLNAFPVPNGATLASELAQFSTSYSNPSDLDATSVRIDHVVNEKLSFFGRYNDAPSNTIQRFVSGNFGGNLAELVLAANETKTLTAGLTWIITPTLTNEFRANWSKATGENSFSLDNFGGAVPPPDSLLFPAFTSREKARLAFVLAFGGMPLYDVGRNAKNSNRQINLVNSTSVVIGPHTLKLGVDYRRLNGTFGPQEYALTARFLNANAVRLARPNSTFSITATQGSNPIFNNFSAFGQDTWRATRRLTLTYGLRWEVNPAPYEANGNALLTVVGVDNLATASLAPRGTPIYETTYGNFAPRFGAVYKVLGGEGRELVLRGGFGIFYDLGNGPAAIAFTGFPFTSTKPLPANTQFPLDPSLAAPAPITLNPPFGNLTAFDSSFKLPRTYQWNFALEQSLGSHQTISASYVGAVGRHLTRNNLVNANPFNSNFRFINIIKNTATSDYHALHLQFQRRLSRGLQTLMNYAWSHSIDDASDEFSSGLQGSRGASDFDVRHAFSAAVTYNLPKPKVGAVGNAILHNWSFDTIVTARSATPVNLVARTQFLSNDGISTPVRPDLIQGVPLYLTDSSAPGGRRFNPAAFVAPPATPFRQGTLGRNVLRGFPIYQLDFSARRQLNLTERWNLQLRADVFNIFNHPNFGDPVGTLTSGSFGRSTVMFGRSLGTGGINGGFNPLYQIGGPRSIQLSLKFQF